MMTTIHGYTNDKSLLDGPHKDLRRAAPRRSGRSLGVLKTAGSPVSKQDGADHQRDGVRPQSPGVHTQAVTSPAKGMPPRT